jgi:P27 family predicted phage terminase small subunit
MTIKEKIILHLQSKGSYDPNIDDEMIDDLIENIAIARKCLKEIKEEGVIVRYETGRGDIMSKINPMVNVYQMFERNVNQISGKLGINRTDRLKLKLIEVKEKDLFDEAMK